jgi:predicted NAD/FAD-dependent oxidoreductase
MDGNTGLISEVRERRVERAKVAIVGAGVSGLVCASTLANRGLDVEVFDKGGRPGGRLATRTTDAGEYDHGAQYLVARDPGFRTWVDSWRREGVVDEWTARVFRLQDDRPYKIPEKDDERWVGVPGMNSIAARISGGLQVHPRTLIRSLGRRNERWFLESEAREEGPFDGLVVAVPAPQAVPLLAVLPILQKRVEIVQMNPCWAVLVSFDSAIDTDIDGAFVDGGPIAWIGRNGSKPERRSESWIVHAAADWSARNLESAPDRIVAALLEELRRVLGVDGLPVVNEVQAHRWRYASTASPLAEPCLSDLPSTLAVCGDWCLGSLVEDAFLSGSAAANQILRALDS